MNLIACVDSERGIGYEGRLLFHIHRDMQLFKLLTTGESVIMGKATFKSIGKPLPNRTNFIYTRDTDILLNQYKSKTVIFSSKVEEIVKKAGDKAFVIGGQYTYETFLPYCDTAYITYVEAKRPSDRKLPILDTNKDWDVITSTPHYFDENEGVSYLFIKLRRR